MVGNVTIEDLKSDLRDLKANLDVFFLVTMGIVIFFMQCGFAFLEAGAVRSKNTTNILIKNMLDVFIGGIAFWLVGYALAYGNGNAFCGTTLWAAQGVEDNALAEWFFQFVFAATAATIVSGSMAERCAFHAYLIYSVALTAVVYPVVAHWAWSGDGWLTTTQYQDFAGSGVVHLTGGVAALVGAIILGPRHGRFGPEGKELRGHSVPLAALGGFILLFGFLAFNGGSQASISNKGDAEAVSKAIVNTVISGSCGGLTVLLVYKSRLCGRPSTWSFLMALNGALTSMVSICAGCNVMPTWGASVTGVVAGLIFLTIHVVLPLLRVDDPLDAVAVHLGGGLWGLIAVAIFQKGGLVDGGPPSTLAWNMIGTLAILSWSGGVCALMFGILRLCGWLRIPLDMEVQGMDILKHGEPAYPAEAWEESQYTASVSSDDQTQRNNYLPPNMTPPWPPANWGGFYLPKHTPVLPYPYGGYPVNWTLPDPTRNPYYHTNRHNNHYGPADHSLGDRHGDGEVGDHYTGSRSRHLKVNGVSNEGFEGEHSKL